jgi:hypothetical protein
VTDALPLIAAAAVTVIVFIVAFSRAVNPRVGGGLAGLTRGTTSTTIAAIVALLVVIAMVPLVGGLTSDAVDRLLLPGGIFVALGGAFIIARQYPPGWASFIAAIVLVACVWVGALSLYLACDLGWQDMTLDDIATGGTSAGDVIRIVLIAGTIVAPLPGLLIGIMARRPEPEMPPA